MARKYEIGPGRFAWTPTRCEDAVLVARYLEICRYIPSPETWKVEFENYFFDRGNGVASDYVDRINAHRRRRSLPEIVFKETDADDYARSPDRLWKSEQRRQLRNELQQMSAETRAKIVAAALAETELLPPPHRTYEEWKKSREQQENEARRSREEVARRVLAQHAEKTMAHRDRSAKMLQLATDPDLREEIISRLSPDDALNLAEQIEEPQIRNALVRHSFKADQHA